MQPNDLTPRYKALLRVLPDHDSDRWLYPFEIAARCQQIAGNSLHDLLKRAVAKKVAARRKAGGGRFQYARAKQ